MMTENKQNTQATQLYKSLNVKLTKQRPQTASQKRKPYRNYEVFRDKAQTQERFLKEINVKPSRPSRIGSATSRNKLSIHLASDIYSPSAASQNYTPVQRQLLKHVRSASSLSQSSSHTKLPQI